MRAKRKWIFHLIRAIESSDDDGQRASICKEANKHMATDFLRSDFFFFNDENIEFKK